MDRESRILTSWYGRAKTNGLGTPAAVNTESYALSDPTPGRIATALQNVLRNGTSRSAMNPRSLKPSESVKKIQHEIPSVDLASADSARTASMGREE